MPGLVLSIGCAAVAFAVHALVPAVSPLVVAVAVGAVLVNVRLWPAGAVDGARFAATSLLRAGVAVLGFKISVQQIGALGVRGMLAVVGTVAVTAVGVRLLGRLLGVSKTLAMLVATGYAICGASAVAAAEGTRDVEPEEVAYAVALVTLCGTLSIAVLPLIGHAVHLAPATFGAWAGASVHDVGQVVAASSLFGPDSLRAAVVVKLARVVLLAPMLVILTIEGRRAAARPAPDARDAEPAANDRPRRNAPIVPLFVLAFLGAVVLRSVVHLPAGLLGGLDLTSTALLAAGLVGLGAGVRISSLRCLGGRPLILGVLAWALVAGTGAIAVAVAGL